MPRTFERRLWKDLDKLRNGKQMRMRAKEKEGGKDQAAATHSFLREKNEQAQEMQKEELELRKQQLEVESKK